MRVLERLAAALAVAVAPDEQRVDDRPEVLAGLGELVEVSAAVVGAEEPVDDAVIDEPVQVGRQDGLGDVEVGLEVVEAAHPVEGVADDEQRPALADDLEEQAGETSRPKPLTPIGRETSEQEASELAT